MDKLTEEMLVETLPVIKKSPLFSGVHDGELIAMLGCLSASQVSYGKKEFILHSGEETAALGVVLRGCVHVFREDFWGNRNLLTQTGPGEIFAEVYACTPGAKLAVSVQAAEPATVLFLDVRRILTVCNSACAFHHRLIRNLLTALAGNTLRLNEKLSHLSQRSTREKLLSYLSAEAMRQSDAEIRIPFDRQQLADYLSVERSALSRELGKLRDEGLLSFSRNRFILYRPLRE